ncbi:T9SS type A sorting domain-containing protein [Cryomorphaceae bacterium]|nr:T9SS type A sorting domain-containing protein [Cryomorphaceae bacterium]
MKLTLLTGAVIGLALQVSGQSFQSVDTNSVRMGINADGSHFWNGAFSQHEVPKGSGLSTLFAGEWWIGGFDQGGSLHLAAQTYRQTGWDFRQGPVNSTGQLDASYSKVWRISQQDVLTHQAQFQDPNYVIPQDILTWPGNGDVSNGEAAQLAPYFDVNGNGIYEPLQGDFPCIRGDQAVYAIYSDQREVQIGNGLDMDVEVHTMLYQFAPVPGAEFLDSIVFSHTEVYSRGTNGFSGVYMGHYVDFDIGIWDDDFFACDVARNLVYGQNGDGNDQGGYGTQPPAQGVLLLGAPEAPLQDGVDNDHDGIIDEPGEQLGFSSAMAFDGSNGALGIPSSLFEYYNCLTAHWADGTPLTRNGGNGHAPTGGTGPTTNFLYPGNTDPAWPGGTWSESTAGNTAGERRALMNIGPMDLDIGDHFGIDLAYVFATDEGIGTSRLVQVADSVRDWFDVQSFSCSSTIGLADEAEVEFSLFPNPVHNELHVQIQAPVEVEWKLYDLSGQLIREGRSDVPVFTLDLENLAAGSYLFEVSGQGLYATKPLVKQ